MIFFDEHENAIPCEQWLNTYLPYYFLDYPKWGGRPRNQTSHYVEDEVCTLLTKTTPLSRKNLEDVMAWKIGLINHRKSEDTRQMAYLQNWPTTLSVNVQYGTRDFSTSIPYLAANMATIAAQLSHDPQYLFNSVRKQDPHLKGFGYVYILTVQFFISHGRFPIYDKFAHVAALAIDQGLPPASPPKSYVKYQLTKWSDYQAYMSLLALIRNACPQQPANSPMFISRDLDRALWVYGHFFETEPNAFPKTTLHRSCTRIPRTAGSGAVLVGRIRDLCQFTTDGWRRREIIVRQSVNVYPREGDRVDLVDSSGGRYTNVPFIKGAGVQGYTCLGQPGALKPWFMRHYRSEQVEAASVYFKPTGQSNEYEIYSESEWRARGQT